MSTTRKEQEQEQEQKSTVVEMTERSAISDSMEVDVGPSSEMISGSMAQSNDPSHSDVLSRMQENNEEGSFRVSTPQNVARTDGLPGEEVDNGVSETEDKYLRPFGAYQSETPSTPGYQGGMFTPGGDQFADWFEISNDNQALKPLTNNVLDMESENVGRHGQPTTSIPIH